MSKTIAIIIIAVVASNAIFLFIYLNKPSPNASNQTIQQTSSSNKTVPKTSTANQSLNYSVYYEKCINSTKKHAEGLENITNITMINSKFFNKSSDVLSYLLHNISSVFYDINGTEKDITNKTVVSYFEIITNRERNFTIPVLCDENGKIGNYSVCLLNKIPNIPSACFNLTINLTECEIEWSEHFIMDDIQYWMTPPGGSIVLSAAASLKNQIFNFTISSSRKRLESFGMNIIERTFDPIISDDVIFSSTKLTPDGKGGSIVKDVNLTGKRNVEFYATIWFTKKCYKKYVIY